MNKNLFFNNIETNVKIFNIKNLLIRKYKIPKKYSHSPFMQSYFGYKINKKKNHNALHDCMSILKSLRKIRFNLNLR